MLWGDLELGHTADGTRYVSYTERATKTRKGINTDPRMFQPKIFEQPGIVCLTKRTQKDTHNIKANPIKYLYEILKLLSSLNIIIITFI
jgi:hypothetical protein